MRRAARRMTERGRAFWSKTRTRWKGKHIRFPALSYESNYTVCFYDKRAMEDLKGDADYVPETWQDLIGLLQAAKEDGYLSPLGLVLRDRVVREFLWAG